ncbi:hypothetical protein BJ165DRAFT_1448343 [Panaeolus papilionaceus]|nr:hypothetical protein BJ165DRAFT_1448343 [Panaeolus papilionaceus]
MEGLGSGPSNALDSTYGAMFVGVLFAAFFQGMLTVQAFSYYDNFPHDHRRNKLIVATVCILDTVHLALISRATYQFVVTNWGFIPSLANSTTELNLHLLFTALTCIVVQLFYLERIWFFSHGNRWLVGALIIICLVPCALDIHLTVAILQKKSVSAFSAHTPEVIAIFTSGALGDLLIAFLICYYLRREQSAFEATRTVIAKIVQFAVGTGLATSLLAVAAVIAYFTKRNSFYFIALHFSLGRTYTNALLATLNARRHMRQMLSQSSKSTPMEFVVGSDNRITHQVPNIIRTMEQMTQSDRGDEPVGGHFDEKEREEGSLA